jgi:hypothetical protein
VRTSQEQHVVLAALSPPPPSINENDMTKYHHDKWDQLVGASVEI